MSKAVAGVMINGVIFLLIGFLLMYSGLPTDKTDAVIVIGHAIFNTLGGSTTDLNVQITINIGNQLLMVMGFLVSIIGFLEIVIPIVVFAREIADAL